MPKDEAWRDELGRLYDLGRAAERKGDLSQAEVHYRACLALDPEDHCGASVRMAALGLADSPVSGAPEAYVATLFDQHAEQFDDILVGQLGYDVPALIAAALDRLSTGPFERMLDLGCGTGLAGEALRDRCSFVVGIDLSENMIELADERGVYDDLYVGEAVSFLEEADEEPFDLIVAADVLPYLGAIEPFMDGARRLTTPSGILAFSTETLPDDAFGDAGFKVGPHQRFHHSATYLRTSLEAAGFSMLAMDLITVRTDEGLPQPGHLVIAKKR